MINVANEFSLVADQWGVFLRIADAIDIDGNEVPGVAHVNISHARALELAEALKAIVASAPEPDPTVMIVKTEAPQSPERKAINAALEKARAEQAVLAKLAEAGVDQGMIDMMSVLFRGQN